MTETIRFIVYGSPRSELDHAMLRLRGLIGSEQDPNHICCFIHEGEPVSKSRARWNRKTATVYTPKSSQTAQTQLAWRFRAVLGKETAHVGSVAIIAIFYRSSRQRIDADNLMKLVMDAGTEARVWRDDSQVAAQAALVELDPTRPRTVVALCPYTSTMDRSPEVFACAKCGKSFERPEWYKRRARKSNRRMFCSVTCSRPTSLAIATCPKCNQDFQRKTAGQRYCSVKCAQTFKNVRLPNGEQRPPKVCELCGNRVSRREYKQCRKCRGYGKQPVSAAEE